MTNLKLRVHAKNQLNSVLIEELKNIIPQLKKYEGQKIVNANGSICKKTPINYIRKNPVPFKNGYSSNQLTYLDITWCSVWLKVSICLNGGKYEDNTYYCIYCDSSVYICDLLKGNTPSKILDVEEIIKNNNLSTDINEEIEASKIQKCKDLKNELNKIKNSILINVEDYELR